MRGNVVFAACCAAALVLVLFLSIPFPMGAKLFPMAVFSIGLVVAIWNLVHAARSPEQPPSEEASAGARKMIPFWALVLSFPLFTWLFGFVFGAPLFMLVFSRFVTRQTWPFTVLMSLTAWGVVYAGFDVLLKANFGPGVLTQLVLH